MNENHGRDLDLNLLRVFTVIAESQSVTAAAAQLYLPPSAINAALRRLTSAVGAPLFARQGRGLILTSRGRQMLAGVQPHLSPLIAAALAPPELDLRTSERTFRLGLSDAAEVWLLPPLLGLLRQEAPLMRVIAVPVQFRNVAAVLGAGGVDAAVTVADDLPAGIRRQALFWGGFVCLFDRRHVRFAGRLREKDYFARDHVVVSYNGDLRGIVEDLLHKQRRVRCSVSSFANLGALLDGTALLATVPALVARQIQALRPHLRACALPFSLPGSSMELLWPAALDDDQACGFLRERIARISAREANRPPGRAE
jgi:LysR family transcriptional regulator, mexEF-oprN operon transcriptional activator